MPAQISSIAKIGKGVLVQTTTNRLCNIRCFACGQTTATKVDVEGLCAGNTKPFTTTVDGGYSYTVNPLLQSAPVGQFESSKQNSPQYCWSPCCNESEHCGNAWKAPGTSAGQDASVPSHFAAQTTPPILISTSSSRHGG